MKIYLIGMPGSGKTTLGKQIARSLTMPFLDLDHEIENSEGRSIPTMFAESGEDYFRQKESEILRNLIAGSESFVLATGGGAPCFFNNMDLLNATGLSIFLDVPASVLFDRLKHTTDRPLLENEQAMEEKINKLYTSRRSIYSKARLTIANPDAEKVIAAIQGINM
jgi:shikimate kinase